MNHSIEMLRPEETFISGNKVTVVDVVPHSFRGNRFLFALHVPKSQIKPTSSVEIEELFSKYFNPYMIPDYMWVKLADYPDTTYRFNPDREVDKVITLEEEYLLHIEVRYTNAKYIPDSINNGYDYPFPVVRPERILSILENNASLKEVLASDIPCEEAVVRFDADIIADLKKELLNEKTKSSAEKVKVAALQRELARKEKKINEQMKKMNELSICIDEHSLQNSMLTSSIIDLKNHALHTMRKRTHIARKQQDFIRQLYVESNRKDDCPICYETITSENLYVSDCCHVSCMSCAQQCYTKSKRKCPICRSDMGVHNKPIICPRVNTPSESVETIVIDAPSNGSISAVV
mgnify:FL=1|uniref:RING-type domain-containing protein n=1 Tax=viral metagenome TaxID=1070528 RepID=A0A6C0AVD3_9ZZZZ|tara:strand:- start:401 stop:1447 length:1047 start_codon:yes stop_codon:yes gene_type:complete